MPCGNTTPCGVETGLTPGDVGEDDPDPLTETSPVLAGLVSLHPGPRRPRSSRRPAVSSKPIRHTSTQDPTVTFSVPRREQKS